MRQVRTHPLANLLPPMSPAEYAALKASIAEDGLRQPILRHRDGRTIDGRNRERVCEELGIPAKSVTFNGPDSAILAVVADANLKRRHLSKSQRAMVAAKVAQVGHGGDRRSADQRANRPLDGVEQLEC